MKQKTTLCRSYRHLSGVFCALLLLASACSKKDIHIVEDKNTKQSVDSNADDESLDDQRGREIFNPFGYFKSYTDKDFGSRHTLIESSGYLGNFYEKEISDLNGKKLVELKIDDESGENRLKLIDFSGDEATLQGHFLKPMTLSLKKDFILNLDRIVTNELQTDRYIFSEGKRISVSLGDMKSLKEISPSSVASVENQMLTPDFKPHCYFRVSGKMKIAIADLKLFEASSQYMIFSRAEVYKTKPDQTKVLINDIIFRKLGSFESDPNIYSAAIESLLKVEPYQLFVQYRPEDVLRLQCVSLYAGELEENIVRSTLSSIFKGHQPKVEKIYSYSDSE